MTQGGLSLWFRQEVLAMRRRNPQPVYSPLRVLYTELATLWGVQDPETHWKYIGGVVQIPPSAPIINHLQAAAVQIQSPEQLQPTKLAVPRPPPDQAATVPLMPVISYRLRSLQPPRSLDGDFGALPINIPPNRVR